MANAVPLAVFNWSGQCVRVRGSRPSGKGAVPSREQVLGAGPAYLVPLRPDERNDPRLAPVNKVWTRSVGPKERDGLVGYALNQRSIKGEMRSSQQAGETTSPGDKSRGSTACLGPRRGRAVEWIGSVTDSSGDILYQFGRLGGRANLARWTVEHGKPAAATASTHAPVVSPTLDWIAGAARGLGVCGRARDERVRAGLRRLRHIERRFAQADETIGGDHQVVENGNAKQLACFACFAGQLDVVWRRRGVA